MEIFQDMTEKGHMLQAYGLQNDPGSMLTPAFLEGKAGMMLGSIASMGGLYKNNENNIDIQAVFQPAGTERSVVTGGANMIIMEDKPEEEKEAAGKFLEYLASDEFVANFAIESGYFATTESAIETPEMQEVFAENLSYKVAVDQIQYAHKRPNQKNWQAMYKVILDELEVALIDFEKDPKETINAAAEKAQKVIDDNQ